MITRRKFLALTGATSALTTAPALFNAAMAEDGFLNITAGPSKHKLINEDVEASNLWLYDNSTPGPEIRATIGDRIKIRLINNLQEPTSIHWHGLRIKNDMDGVSGLTQDPVMPGEQFEYDFTVPDAGTFWYHAHNKSWNQVARGLYGPLIIDEQQPAFDKDHDITLVIDDWRVKNDGSFDEESLGSLMDWSHGGRLGNWLTVNGSSRPSFTLKRGESYRLRLINAANARILDIDPSRFGALVLAYDGQPLTDVAPPLYAPMLLGPAQRLDLVVTPEDDFELEELSGSSPFAFARFKVTGEKSNATPVQYPRPNDLPEPDLEQAKVFEIDMTGGAMGRSVETTYQGRVLSRKDIRTTGQVWAFNGVANLASGPFFSVEAGESVILSVMNNTAFAHAMHVHGHHFRIIERSGASVNDGMPWRDTFLIGPNQRVKIAFVADNPGKWLFHCHMLEHAAAGMNTWFQVKQR
ncbi:multicopper oxidase family protein [Pseudovibrio denitrificans]|uniref:multicopper oxidase family protein n=1 Tax=Pseudovibrio denitrificans TaxID=258256 RepID=UPI0039BF91E4